MTSVVQIPFRYRHSDNQTGVSRSTARRMGEALGLDETALIHMALHELAIKVLPQYEADDGPLTAADFKRIRTLIPQQGDRRIASSLFDMPAPAASTGKAKKRAGN